MSDREISELEEVRAAEEHNFEETKGALGGASGLSNDYAELYDLLSKLVGPLKSPESHENEAHLIALHFAGACRCQLTKSALAIFRGHLNDSLLFLRKAIELCAFAALVKRHPHKATAWIRANDDKDSYAHYRQQFGNQALFPKGQALLQDLYRRYDWCSSKALHGSIYSMAGHVNYGSSGIQYNYFDVRPNDFSFVSQYYYLLDTHRRILEVFAQAFAKEIAARTKEWEVALNSVEAKANYYREYWNTIIPKPTT